MFTESSAFYDLIYSTFKDYSAEGAEIARRVRALRPDARTILDVACGTGEHARALTALGFDVDGIDLDPGFVRIAQQKNSTGRFVDADMSDFHLGRRYDAVLCLFSSIGYLVTLDRVTRALICFREHLAPGGVVLIEPWFPPGLLDPNRVAKNTGEANGVKVVRTSRVEIEGRISRLLFDYEITDRTGTRHASEVHELGLFTPPELTQAFTTAGFSVDFDHVGLTDRGLYLATVAAR
jgi:SAM-dependent methyltransferase